MRTSTEPPSASAKRLAGAAAVMLIVLLIALGLLTGLDTVAASDPAPQPSTQPSGLAVDVAVEPAVRPGARLQYTVHYTNTTSGSVAGVRLVCALSPGQEFDGEFQSVPAISPDAFQWSDLNLEWYIASLGAGASGAISLATYVNDEPEPSAEQSVHLVGISAEIEAEGGGTEGGRDSAVAQLVGPILEVSASENPDPVVAGFPLTYTLAVANLERSDAIPATGVVVTNVLPEHTIFRSVSHGGEYKEGEGLVRWQLAEPLTPGTTEELFFVTQVEPNTPAGTKIVYDRDEFGVTADELKLGAVAGRKKLSTRVDGLLAKSGESLRVSLGAPGAYPGELVTFTLIVRNYSDGPLTGVRVTDTLPAVPDPFEFLSVVDGGPPPIVDGAMLIWEGLALPANGEATRKYLVRVPSTTSFGANSSLGRELGSQLVASHPEVEFGPVGGAGSVRVLPPLVLNVTAKPGLVQSGETVTYTLALENRAPFPITGIRLTDTIDGPEFRYTGMIEGPAPEQEWDDNPIAWSGLEVPADSFVRLIFNVRAVGFPLVSYRSTLTAHSPETTVPIRSGRAGVKIDSPFRIAKVLTPDLAMIGDRVHVDVDLTSVATSTWALDRATDKLPLGFYEVTTGQPVVVSEFNPPFQIGPGMAWHNSYEALVSADLNCAALPKKYVTRRGDFRIDVGEPINGAFVNATDIGSIEVEPHVDVRLVPSRSVVMQGSPIEYRLELDNRSLKHITGIDILVTLPEEFQFLSASAGPPPTPVDNTLQWSGIEIGQGAKWHSDYRVRVGTKLGTRYSKVEPYTENPAFCVQHYTRVGAVQVVNDLDRIMTLELTPTRARVSPAAIVQFDLQLHSKVAEAYQFTTVTSTLPSGFEYHSMVSGPAPVVSGAVLIWSDVEVPGRAKHKLQFRAVAPTLFGSYVGSASAHTPELPILRADGKAVSIVPLIQITKAASRSYVEPGSTVAYTISLVNVQDQSATGVRVTDTLPAQLEYVGMQPGGQAPISLGSNRRQPSWDGIMVPRNGGVETLVLVARVLPGAQPGVYYNRVSAHAPNALLPGTDDTAPITITLSSGTVFPTPTRPNQATQTPSSTSVGPSSTPTDPATPLPTVTPGGPSVTPPEPTAVVPTATTSVRAGTIYMPFASRGW